MAECKFKVGDMVRILPRKQGQATQFPSYVEEMLAFAGEIHKVISVTGKDALEIGEYGDETGPWGYQWHEDWLELATPRKKRILK